MQFQSSWHPPFGWFFERFLSHQYDIYIYIFLNSIILKMSLTFILHNNNSKEKTNWLKNNFTINNVFYV